MHLDFIQIVFLALLQGLTELFPISSLGHTVILPALFGWGDLVRNESFLPIIVSLHLGTSIALIIYFYKDWLKIINDLYSSIKDGEIKQDSDSWISWLIIIGTLPAGIIGVFLETTLKKLFASPTVASAFLLLNGIILYFGERLIQQQQNIKKGQTISLKKLTWPQALIIGFGQSLALLPGISRSGITMIFGLSQNLDHEEAARFSFLLGTPIIAAAAILEIPQLFTLNANELLLVLIGSILSGITAFFSTKFLLKYFENGKLRPFGIYCMVSGLICLMYFLIIH